MAQGIKIEKKDGKIYVTSDYHSDLPWRAKELGGRWQPATKSWAYDEAKIDQVKAIYTKVYGIYGDIPVAGDDTADTVHVRITFDDGAEVTNRGIYFGGHCIAWATGRDSNGRLSDKATLIKGNVTSGGSRANWRTVVEPGTIIDVYDIPATAATSVAKEAAAKDGITIDIITDADLADDTAADDTVATPIAEADTVEDLEAQVAALDIQRKALVARLQRIDRQIADINNQIIAKANR
jgi:hypothetical protein